MDEYTISVIIPVYGAEPYLRQCLDSITEQSFRGLEIILIDDGSPDKSGEICEEYARRDGHIRVVRQENAGPGAARNRGIEMAGGEFLAFLDADDWFEKDFLRNMLARALETGADVTICRSVEFDTDGGQENLSAWMLKEELLPGTLFAPDAIADRIFQVSYGWTWDKLYRADYVRRFGLSFPALRNSEDLVFTFPSLALAGSIAVLPEIMVHHRVNNRASVSNTRDRDPDAPFRAAQLLRESLRQNGVYGLYERSFLNWCVDFLVWHVATLNDRATQKEVFGRLREEWLPALGAGDSALRLLDRRGREKYLLVRRAPFAVFTAALKLYGGRKRVLKTIGGMGKGKRADG